MSVCTVSLCCNSKREHEQVSESWTFFFFLWLSVIRVFLTKEKHLEQETRYLGLTSQIIVSSLGRDFPVLVPKAVKALDYMANTWKLEMCKDN